MKKPKTILRRLLLGLLAFLAVGVTIGVVLGIVYLSRQRATFRADIAEGKRLPQELAAARADGLPTTAADLQTTLPPVAENAAPIYVRLGQVLKSRRLTPNQEILEKFSSHLEPTRSDWTQAAEAVHERPDLYTLIHQAAIRPKCVFAHDWTTIEPEKVQFPELETIRESARLLTAQSLILAHQGQIKEAIQNETLGFAIAQQAGTVKTLIAYLVEIACHAITLDSLKQIVMLDHGSSTTAAVVQSTIESHWHLPSASAALKWDLAGDLAEINYIRMHGPDKPSAEVPQQGYDEIMDANSVYLLRQMRKAILVADQPYPVSQPLLTQIDRTADKNSTFRLTHMLTSIMLPMTASTAEKRTNIQTLVDVDLAGYAVLVAKGKTGKLPERLPGTFADPFTNKPLEYRREGKMGFVVYCAGPNGDFDGGKPGVKPKNFQTYFRYPAVPEK